MGISREDPIPISVVSVFCVEDDFDVSSVSCDPSVKVISISIDGPGGPLSSGAIGVIFEM